MADPVFEAGKIQKMSLVFLLLVALITSSLDNVLATGSLECTSSFGKETFGRISELAHQGASLSTLWFRLRRLRRFVGGRFAYASRAWLKEEKK